MVESKDIIRPRIGTKEWLDQFKFDHSEAMALVESRQPVFLAGTDETGEDGYAIIFENTNFWADFFSCEVYGEIEAKELARQMTEEWNRKISAQTPAHAEWKISDDRDLAKGE